MTDSQFTFMGGAAQLYSLLADAVLVIHFAFVAFVLVGLVVIWVGHFLHWGFVRNFYFRLAHLAAMGIVMLEALAGMVCPLTTWENQLRLLAGGGLYYAGSFMQHWLHKVLFYEASEDTFRVVYLIVFASIALSFGIVRPRWPRRHHVT